MNLDTLEKLADAATPGPWRKTCHGVVVADKGTGNTDDDYIVMWDDMPEHIETDATYIAAANPATIKSLIALCKLQHEMISKEFDYQLRNDTEGQWHILKALAAFDNFNKGE